MTQSLNSGELWSTFRWNIHELGSNQWQYRTSRALIREQCATNRAYEQYIIHDIICIYIKHIYIHIFMYVYIMIIINRTTKIIAEYCRISTASFEIQKTKRKKFTADSYSILWAQSITANKLENKWQIGNYIYIFSIFTCSCCLHHTHIYFIDVYSGLYVGVYWGTHMLI